MPHVGLNIVWVEPDSLLDMARLAEDCGFESVWSGEHVALPITTLPVGAMESEHDSWFDAHSPFLDPLAALSAVAGATERIRLGVGIYLLALRHPLIVGRTIATLDKLSGGRLDLGIGVGWADTEYRLTNNDFHTRGRRTDEMIDALTCLFSERQPEFHGKFFDWPAIGFEPKPVQQPRPRMFYGGFSEAALDRAARVDGFYGSAAPPDQLKPLIDDLNRRREKLGREDAPWEMTVLSINDPIETRDLEAWGEIGVARVVVTPFGGRVGESGPESFDLIRRYAKKLGLKSQTSR